MPDHNLLRLYPRSAPKSKGGCEARPAWQSSKDKREGDPVFQNRLVFDYSIKTPQKSPSQKVRWYLVVPREVGQLEHIRIHQSGMLLGFHDLSLFLPQLTELPVR